MIPIITSGSQGLMPITDLKLTVLLAGTTPGKENPPYHIGKVEGSGDCQTPKAVEGAATQYTPSMGHKPSPLGQYACYGYIPKGCSGANPNV